MPPKDFHIIQSDMNLAEDIGFEKLNILSQRGNGHIKDDAEIVHKNKGIKVDVHNIPRFKKDDLIINLSNSYFSKILNIV